MSIIPRTRASWCYYVDSKQRQCTRLITTQASSCAEHARARTWLSQATWRILLWLIVFSGLRPGHQRPARLLCWFISCTPRGRRASPQPCWAITPKQKAQMSTKTTPQWALQNHLQHRPSLLSTCSLGLQVYVDTSFKRGLASCYTAAVNPEPTFPQHDWNPRTSRWVFTFGFSRSVGRGLPARWHFATCSDGLGCCTIAASSLLLRLCGLHSHTNQKNHSTLRPKKIRANRAFSKASLLLLLE